MRRRIATAAVALACGIGGTAVVTGASATAVAAPAAPAHAASCTYGRIGGVTKCLRAGEYCARRYRSQYRRYGFSCSKLDRRGDWHLVRS